MTHILDRVVADTTRLQTVVLAATGRDDGQVHIDAVDRDPIELSNMTTAALGRVRGSISGHPWSVMVKVVQSPEHSTGWQNIPSHIRRETLADLSWRSEPAVYRSTLGDHLPDHLRLPAVYAVDEMDDTHVVLWMEDVAHVSGPWVASDYHRAARALGRMAARQPEARAPLPLGRRTLRGYFSGRVLQGIMPSLSLDETWSHPLLADAVATGIRPDLAALAETAPAILDRLDTLPRTLAHGDACPANLLRSSTAPGTFVLIDWQFAGYWPAGFDIGQLLAGRAETGELDPADLPGLLQVVVEGYSAGVRDEQSPVRARDIYVGGVGSLVIRSAFSAVPLELLQADHTEQLVQLVGRRCAYARFLLDLVPTVLE